MKTCPVNIQIDTMYIYKADSTSPRSKKQSCYPYGVDPDPDPTPEKEPGSGSDLMKFTLNCFL